MFSGATKLQTCEPTSSVLTVVPVKVFLNRIVQSAIPLQKLVTRADEGARPLPSQQLHDRKTLILAMDFEDSISKVCYHYPQNIIAASRKTI